MEIMRQRNPWSSSKEVKLVKGGENHTIHDIWISELGMVMVSVYDETRKVTVNYNVQRIENILPKGHSIAQEVHQPH
jgi:hypothetical protein